MIYFVQRKTDSKIKIGKTNQPKHRFTSLVLEHGQMTGLGYLEGYTEEEINLHEKFSHLRIENTEFFHPDESLLFYINNNTIPLDMGISEHTKDMCCVELAPGFFCRKKKYFDLSYCKKHAKENGLTNLKKKVQIVAIVSEDTEKELKKIAVKNNNSIAGELRNAISFYLDSFNRKEII